MKFSQLANKEMLSNPLGEFLLNLGSERVINKELRAILKRMEGTSFIHLFSCARIVTIFPSCILKFIHCRNLMARKKIYSKQSVITLT